MAESWYPKERDFSDFYSFVPPNGALRGVGADEGDELQLRNKMSALALLYDIPFPYLVPADELLPPENLRFFYLDDNWIRSLLDGALSIGRNVGADTACDNAFLESVYESAMNGAEIYRAMLQGKTDETLRNFSSRSVDAICTGFLLRSQLVSGWRGVEIAAYRDVEGMDRIKTLRLEALSDEVLIGLFGGIIGRLEIQQPPESFHFGFNNSNGSRTKRLRDLEEGALIYEEEEVTIVERGNRVIDIKATAEAMKNALGMDGKEFTSAHMALEMIQNPYTAVIKIGDVK